ncbi:MAG: RsmG family class I SAM-dependent methyltransferase [Balneolaceae bacterium]
MFHVKHHVIHSSISQESLLRLNDLLDKNYVKLSQYSEELFWWNSKVNLVSRDVSHETILEHIKHSLLVATTDSFINAKNVIDTGTGGGLPGIPLAICFPEKEFVLNDIVSKKLVAVKQILRKLNVENARTESGSISNVEIGRRDLVITKHAFKVFELTNYLQGKSWETLIFLKGEKEAVLELESIDTPLNVSITNLDKVIDNPFYKGKAIVEVTRKLE